MNLRNLSIVFFLSISFSFLHSQEGRAKDSIVKIQEFDEITLPRNYHFKYKSYLKKVRRVYPLALHAAYIIDSLDQVLEQEDKKRKQKRIARQTHRDLKNDFKYLLKSLYISEGIVLSKLIYRETGMTVSEIIEKYKNGVQSSLYTGLAGMFDQDLDAKYDPNGEDLVIEIIIQDILNGTVTFDDDIETLSRSEYREDRAEYRQGRRELKKRKRKRKREKRRAKRRGDD